jgi:[ribosomal protein S5]-alanine N-acetyltransferase
LTAGRVYGMEEFIPAAVAARTPLMHNPFLIGPTIYLRALEKADAPALTPWFNDPDVTRFMLTLRPLSVAAEEAFIAGQNTDPMEPGLGIVVRETDRLVGATGLAKVDVRHRHAMFGIGIGDKSAWGKGYGTETTRLMVGHAFETLNLNRVWLHVYEFNQRGIRAYEKVGFRVEGRLRQDCYREGRYWDTVLMAILREEWQKKS